MKPIALDSLAALALAPKIEYVGRVCLVMIGTVTRPVGIAFQKRNLTIMNLTLIMICFKWRPGGDMGI